MRFLTTSLALALLAALPAHATVIEGNAVDSSLGDLGYGSTIPFYIPLSTDASGNFGEGAGESPDTCTIGGSPLCGGGELVMYLLFDPVVDGVNELDLWFEDLDLWGANDPIWFTEAVKIEASPITETVSFVWDVLVASFDQDFQTLSAGVFVDDANLDYVVRLTFTSDINRWSGTYTNTVELVRPTMVPEPGMLSLLGAGLIIIGLVGRRRRMAVHR